jgi:hypothetical protein
MNLLRLAAFATLIVQHGIIPTKHIAPAWTLDLHDPGEIVGLTSSSVGQDASSSTAGRQLWQNLHAGQRGRCTSGLAAHSKESP